MPTLFTHAAVGIVAGSCCPNRKPFRFRAVGLLCAVIPDADVLAFAFGIPYGHFFGHRGFFHSLFFALVFSGFTAIAYLRSRFLTRRGLGIWGLFLLITASHGVLDAFTNGGLGIALLSPFTSTRYFFPVTPVQVSPIGIRGFFSCGGLSALKSEVLWIWLPPAGPLLIRAVYFRLRR